LVEFDPRVTPGHNFVRQLIVASPFSPIINPTLPEGIAMRIIGLLANPLYEKLQVINLC
jgi:hypothetical protein